MLESKIVRSQLDNISRGRPFGLVQMIEHRIIHPEKIKKFLCHSETFAELNVSWSVKISQFFTNLDL